MKHFNKFISLLLCLSMLLSMIPATFAAQEDAYHDPAEHWLTCSNRTNELDVNAIVTHETFLCRVCDKETSFLVFRTPEYTLDGKTALTRNVRYSDGTMVGGNGTGEIYDGIPGVDSFYTGYHWTKAVCETCGTPNTNTYPTDYHYSRNVYWLYDCAPEFTEQLPVTEKFEFVDGTYHKTTTSSGYYCCFCFGTNQIDRVDLDKHNMKSIVLPQPGNQRFATVSVCKDCGYTETAYTASKSVVASYFGIADGEAHTITVSDLSDKGVSVTIRYGNTADSCRLTSAPMFTEAGQYTVYYEITYDFGGESMTENLQSAEYAREHGELDRYRASNKANLECADAITEAINDNYSANCLNTDAAYAAVSQRYSAERIGYVLASTIREADWDLRYSRSNKVWAATVPTSDDVDDRGRQRHPARVSAHPGLVDLFAEKYRNVLRQQEKAAPPAPKPQLTAPKKEGCVDF